MTEPTGGSSAADDLEFSVSRMAKIGGCWSPSFSPDGSRLAFISNLNGIPQVWTVPVTGGWPELVTGLDDQIYTVFWSPGGEWLAFSLAPGGGMNQQIYVIRPDGMGLRRLTDGGKDNNWLFDWSRDGRALLVASNRRTPEALDAYIVEAASGEMRLAVQNRGMGFLSDMTLDRQWGILYRMINRSDNNLFLVNLTTGAETLLTPHEGPGSFDLARLSPDGRTVYLTSNKDREMIALARIALGDGGTPGPIEVIAAREDGEVEAVEVTQDGRTAAVVWNVAGRSVLSFLDLETLALTPGPALPAETVLDIRFSPDGRLVALTLTGAAAPRNIWVLDRLDGRLWQVTHSQHPGVDLSRLVTPELVRFNAHDGLELSGWLYLPGGYSKPGPMVLSFHGGPEAQERPYFSATYQALLAQGIAVFAPNVRGSSGFGKTFVNLDNGPLRFNGVRDIQSCVQYVVGARIAAPGRIGIMGGSYGGFMTMAGLTEYPDLFAAGTTICGIVNFETFFANTEPWMAEISKVQYGDPVTQADLLRALSPIHKIDRVTAATLVLHGANDTNVPLVEARQVIETLEQRGVPVKGVIFPDEGHGFTKEPNRIRAAVETVRWFAQVLKS